MDRSLYYRRTVAVILIATMMGASLAAIAGSAGSRSAGADGPAGPSLVPSATGGFSTNRSVSFTESGLPANTNWSVAI
ncbi:MAG: hypothetical protein ACREDE_11775, partial [Thermoplasmata archaeon]